MKNTNRKNKNVAVVIKNELRNLAEVFVLLYSIALGLEKRVARKVKLVCGVVASAITLVVTIIIVNGSFIWTGCEYAFLSLWRHFAVALGNDSGNWNHIMTGGSYEATGYLKSELIANNGFAKFLNGLAGHGIIAKFTQIAIILACVAILIALISVLCKCIARLVKVWRTKNNRRNRKVVDIRTRRRA